MSFTCSAILAPERTHSVKCSAEWGIRSIPSDHTKLGEMEFYLLEDLEFNLTVFHPYQDLADLCTTQDGDDASNSRELSGRGKLVLEEGAMQTAWYVFVIPLRSLYL